MIQCQPFAVSDIFDMDVQPKHRYLLSHIRKNLDELTPKLENGRSYTLWCEFGYPVTCLGVLDNDLVWGFLSTDMRRYMVQVTREAKRLRDFESRERPIYAEIDPTFLPAVRWAKMCGFKVLHDNLWVYANEDPLRS